MAGRRSVYGRFVPRSVRCVLSVPGDRMYGLPPGGIFRENSGNFGFVREKSAGGNDSRILFSGKSVLFLCKRLHFDSRGVSSGMGSESVAVGKSLTQLFLP